MTKNTGVGRTPPMVGRLVAALYAACAAATTAPDDPETNASSERNETDRKDLLSTTAALNAVPPELITPDHPLRLGAEDFNGPYAAEIIKSVRREIAPWVLRPPDFFAAVRGGAPGAVFDTPDGSKAGAGRQGFVVSYFSGGRPSQVAGILPGQDVLIEAGSDDRCTETWAVATNLKDRTTRDLIPGFQARFEKKRLAEVQLASHITRSFDDLGRPRSEQFLPYLGALSRESCGIYLHNAGFYSCLEMLRGQVACYINMSCPAHDAAYLAALWAAVAGPHAVSDFSGNPLVWDKSRFDIVVGHPRIRAEIVDVFKSVRARRGGFDAA